MENPVKAVTSGISIGKALGLVGTLILVFAILDVLNVTDWVLYPVSSAKSKWMK